MITLAEAIATREEMIREHQRDIAGLDTVIAYLRRREEMAQVAPPELAGPVSIAMRPITFPTVPLPDGWPKGDSRMYSLKDYIVPLVSEEAEKVWTAREMCTALIERGVFVSGIDINAQINNVSTVMAGLAADGGPLLQTLKGIGRRASQYKFRDAQNEAEMWVKEDGGEAS